MQIRSLHEIEQDLIYQEPNYENKSFWTFLIDFKRSDRYSSTLSFVLFMALIWIFMFFTIIYKKDYMFFISIGFVLLFCFIFAQFLLWNFCYKIENDNFLFGIVLFKKCYFTCSRKFIDIHSFYINKDFSEYVFVFNHGIIKYTLNYNPQNKRMKELEIISKLALIPLKIKFPN